MASESIPEAWREDTQDIGRTVRAVYACISGSGGAPRDWARFRYLHHARAMSLRTEVEEDGTTRAVVFDVEAYIADVSPFFAANGFHEIEVERQVRRDGQVAHAWSRHEAKATPDSPELLKRGANSIQLCYERGRWWIFSTVWDNARAGLVADPW